MRGAWWTYRWTACVILSSLAGSLAAEKSVVHELTEKDYDKFVADNTAFLISFTAPWCGHSRALRPEYEKAAHSLTSQGLPVTHVDGTENEALATRLDVKGYPTIFFVRGDATIEFDGNRKASELQRWALSKLKPPAPMLATEAEVDSWVKGKKTALVLFVGSGELDPALREAYLAVAAAVEQPCAMSSATGRISANAPALAMFKTFDGGAPVVMSGELSRSRMQTFAQGRFDGQAFGFLHIRMSWIARLADAHGVIRGAELHHVDAGHRENVLDVLHALAFFHHQRDDDIIQGVDISLAARFEDHADVSPHAYAHKAITAGCLGAYSANAGLCIFQGPHVGKQDTLKARADSAGLFLVHRLP